MFSSGPDVGENFQVSEALPQFLLLCQPLMLPQRTLLLWLMMTVVALMLDDTGSQRCVKGVSSLSSGLG